MNKKNYFIVSSILFCIGVLFFAYQQELIILRFPQCKKNDQSSIIVTKKNIPLYYWFHGKWHKEIISSIWPHNKALALEYLITSWLHLLENEQIPLGISNLQRVILSPNSSELFISFDASLFLPEQTIQEKLMIIESLLKTIKENDPMIQKVRFLVNHKPLNDYHLDFTNSWPIQGFLS